MRPENNKLPDDSPLWFEALIATWIGALVCFVGLPAFKGSVIVLTALLFVVVASGRGRGFVVKRLQRSWARRMLTLPIFCGLAFLSKTLGETTGPAAAFAAGSAAALAFLALSTSAGRGSRVN